MNTDAERTRLNRTCAEAFGFVPTVTADGGWWLRTPDGTGREGAGLYHASAEKCWDDAPDFTRDMNLWVKWGLPWLGEQGYDWSIESLSRIGMSRQVAITYGKDDWRPLPRGGPLSDLPLLLARLVERLQANT